MWFSSSRRNYRNGCEIFAQQKNVFLIMFLYRIAHYYYNGFEEDIYIYKMSEFFSKPYKFSCIYVKIDLSNYITKDDVKNVTGADTSNVAEK